MRRFAWIVGVVGGATLLTATAGWAGGHSFGVGCVGVCGIEQTVFDGQTTCVVSETNIATDTDLIHLTNIHVVVNHADGDEDLGNVIPVQDGQQSVLVSPHSEFRTTFVLRPHAADLQLPNQILPLRVTVDGEVLFDVVDHPPGVSSGPIRFASFGDITHVLATNPTVCGTAASASTSLILHTRHRSFHRLARRALRIG